MEQHEKLSVNTVFRYFVLIAVGIILIYPLFWMIGSAFKTNIDIFGGLSIFPPSGRGTTENFNLAWNITKKHNLIYYFGNTLKFLIPKTIFTLLSCTMTAFVVARRQFKGKKFVFAMIIFTLLMPDLAFRLPLFKMFVSLKLINTSAALYIGDIFAISSFFIFMEIQFMRTIPKELDEAAFMDGCNSLQTLFYIIIPVLKPIIITVALLCFMWGMNDYQGPLIFLQKPDTKVLSQILKQQLDGDAEIIYGKVFAASVIALVPMIALFFAGSRYFVDGVANSGGKE